MIEVKNKLCGSISTKERLNSKLNIGIERLYPELEDLTVIPSIEEQHFKSEKYGYNDVIVKEIETEELSIIPSTENQINEGLFNKVTVVGDSDLIPKNIKKGTTIFNVEGSLEALDTSDANATAGDIALGKTAYVKGEKIIGSLEVGDYNAEIDTSIGTSFSVQNCITKINKLDTSNCTSITFSGCVNLETIPQIDISRVTNLSSMFYNCKKITTIPQIDTSNVTIMNSMFKSCINLKNIPQMNTSHVTTMNSMFADCSSLQEIKALNLQSATNIANIFGNCTSIENIELLNTGKVTAFNQAFYACSSLKSLNELNCENVTSLYNIFIGCSSLSDFGGLKNIGKSFTQTSNNYYNYEIRIFLSPLTHESLMNIINNLYDLNLTYNVAGGGTLYTQNLALGNDNIAKLTAEEIAIATNKGWNIS